MIEYKEYHNGELVNTNEFSEPLEAEEYAAHRLSALVSANGVPAQWATAGTDTDGVYHNEIVYSFDNDEQWKIAMENANE